MISVYRWYKQSPWSWMFSVNKSLYTWDFHPQNIGGIVMDKTNNSSWMVATSKIWNTGQTNMALPIKPLGHSILNCLVLWTVWTAEWKIDVSWHHHPIPNEKTNRVEHQHVLTPTASLGNSHWNWLPAASFYHASPLPVEPRSQLSLIKYYIYILYREPYPK